MLDHFVPERLFVTGCFSIVAIRELFRDLGCSYEWSYKVLRFEFNIYIYDITSVLGIYTQDEKTFIIKARCSRLQYMEIILKSGIKTQCKIKHTTSDHLHCSALVASVLYMCIKTAMCLVHFISLFIPKHLLWHTDLDYVPFIDSCLLIASLGDQLLSSVFPICCSIRNVTRHRL